MPRAKKSKEYRKLMEEFSMGFGFRVPYQVLVDADFIAEANRCKMDMARRLKTTLHGEVKPMITQCSMRHLYERKSEPGVEAAIEQAKTEVERRRCGHHPDEYPEPLSAMECIKSVVDPKNNATNKHRYVCAINDEALRASLRQVAGTPLVFIRRSVMIMEPMAGVSAEIRSQDEKSKFRAELKTPTGKRKRDEDDGSDQDKNDAQATAAPAEAEEPKKKKKNYGPKEPNPLAVKKKKKPESTSDEQPSKAPEAKVSEATASDAKAPDVSEVAVTEADETKAPKRKRRRRHKSRRAPATETSTVAPDAAGADVNTDANASTNANTNVGAEE